MSRVVLVVIAVVVTASGGAQAVAPGRGTRHDVRICVGGDVTLGTNLDSGWAHRNAIATGDAAGIRHRPDALVAPVRALVEDADIVIINAEGAIGDGPVDAPKCDLDGQACYLLRSPRAAVRVPALRRRRPECPVGA